jgi:hypothetical protein
MIQEDEVHEINIDLVDLEELARVNPLAWEQLLHIADTRILKARIAKLEETITDSMN